MRKEITDELITDLFSYRDGKLYWNVNHCNAKIGTEAGYISPSDGYRYIKINGTQYLTHRIIFFMFNGYVPEYIDHKNTVRGDNDISNLRECTASENQHNKALNKNNKSGIKGVYWHKQRQKWHARLWFKGEVVFSKLFSCLDEAEASLKVQRHFIHGDFAKSN